MPDQYTSRNRLTKQEIGSNEATWGNILNEGVIQLIDESLDGQLTLDVTLSNITLTQLNGSTDESRFRFLEILNTSASNREVIIPNVQKLYKIKFVKSGTGNLTIRNSTDPTGVTLTASSDTEIRCDGAATTLFGGGSLRVANNLSDVASVSTARTNLDVFSKSESTALSVLVGEIRMYGGASAPPMHVLCDGQALSRTTYAALFAVIGTNFGNGDGTTTFNVPDLRGEFVRGWDNGRGVDTGRTLGSNQTDMLKAHEHSYTAYSFSTGDANGGIGIRFASGYATNTGSVGGAETRPRNVAVNYIICTGQ